MTLFSYVCLPGKWPFLHRFSFRFHCQFLEGKIQCLFAYVDKTSAAELSEIQSLLHEVSSHQVLARLTLCHAFPATARWILLLFSSSHINVRVYFNTFVIQRFTSLAKYTFLLLVVFWTFRAKIEAIFWRCFSF